MTTSHFLLMVLYRVLRVARLRRAPSRRPREQLRTGAMMFGGFVAAAFVLGWLMFPLPL